jgi:hypothetical protein
MIARYQTHAVHCSREWLWVRLKELNDIAKCGNSSVQNMFYQRPAVSEVGWRES